jgi:hypothetical protein
MSCKKKLNIGFPRCYRTSGNSNIQPSQDFGIAKKSSESSALKYDQPCITQASIDEDIKLQQNVTRRQSMKKIALIIGVLGAVFATSSMALSIDRYDRVIKVGDQAKTCTGCKTPGSPNGSYYINEGVTDSAGNKRGRAEARWQNVDASTFAKVEGNVTIDGTMNRVSILQIFKDKSGPVAMLAIRKSGSKRIVYNEKGTDNCTDYKAGALAEAFINNNGYMEVWYNHVNCGRVQGTGAHYFKHGAYHTNSGTGSGNAKWSNVKSSGG